MMKNKSKLIKIAIATAVLVVAVSVLLICLLRRGNEQDNSQEGEVSAREAIQSAIQAKLDFAQGDDEAVQDKIFVQIESKNGFEVVSFTEEEAGGVATLRVYAPNLYEVARSIDEGNQYSNDEELENAIIEAISNAEIVEKELTVEFKATDDGYEPILTMEFVDAYYGGIFKLLNERLAENQAKENVQ